MVYCRRRIKNVLVTVTVTVNGPLLCGFNMSVEGLKLANVHREVLYTDEVSTLQSHQSTALDVLAISSCQAVRHAVAASSECFSELYIGSHVIRRHLQDSRLVARTPLCHVGSRALEDISCGTCTSDLGVGRRCSRRGTT